MTIETILHQAKNSLEIQNVVGTASIDAEIALKEVALDLKGAEYDHESFPGIVYSTNDGSATSLIYRSGKITTTGAQSVTGVEEATYDTIDALSQLGIDVGNDSRPNVTVQNVVSDTDLGEPLNLEAIAIGFGLENIEYEPEQFPGLLYRLDDPPVMFLLFGTGKLVIVGAETLADAKQGLEVITSQLDELNLLG